MKIKIESSFIFNTKYWIKHCIWVVLEYLSYGFFVGLGAIIAIKLFY